MRSGLDAKQKAKHMAFGFLQYVNHLISVLLLLDQNLGRPLCGGAIHSTKKHKKQDRERSGESTPKVQNID